MNNGFKLEEIVHTDRIAHITCAICYQHCRCDQEGVGEMNIQTFKTQTTEVMVEGNGVLVTVNPWSNLEGMSVMVHEEKGLALRAAFSMRWEEADVLMMAMTAARSA